MSLGAAATAFVTVFLAELPDKTMVATIVLVARFRRPGLVWAGATAAFSVHVTVAVVAGSAIGRLPDRVVGVAVFLLFSAGAVAMALAARRPVDVDDAEAEASPASARRVLTGSFAFIALAEWGDLTQLATAGLAARSDAAASVWVGAIIALATVAAIAALTGRQLVRRVPIGRINLVAAVVFASLAVWTLIDVVRGP
ncbi:MAG: TMEM165/GDT1 family protein [Actinomycetota bacterium]